MYLYGLDPSLWLQLLSRQMHAQKRMLRTDSRSSENETYGAELGLRPGAKLG